MAHRGGTAVCVLRVERQSDGLLITMTTSADIDADQPEVVRRFGDAAGALAAVAAFLRAATPPS